MAPAAATSRTLQDGVEVLLCPECWSLLREAQVGRLAVAGMNQPDLFPVNHIVDHGTVAFRANEGTKLAAAMFHVIRRVAEADRRGGAMPA